MRASSRRHLHVDVFPDALNSDDTSEHGLSHGYSRIGVHVAALPPEELRLRHPERYENLKRIEQNMLF